MEVEGQDRRVKGARREGEWRGNGGGRSARQQGDGGEMEGGRSARQEEDGGGWMEVEAQDIREN